MANVMLSREYLMLLREGGLVEYSRVFERISRNLVACEALLEQEGELSNNDINILFGLYENLSNDSRVCSELSERFDNLFRTILSSPDFSQDVKQQINFIYSRNDNYNERIRNVYQRVLRISQIQKFHHAIENGDAGGVIQSFLEVFPTRVGRLRGNDIIYYNGNLIKTLDRDWTCSINTGNSNQFTHLIFNIACEHVHSAIDFFNWIIAGGRTCPDCREDIDLELDSINIVLVINENPRAGAQQDSPRRKNKKSPRRTLSRCSKNIAEKRVRASSSMSKRKSPKKRR